MHGVNIKLIEALASRTTANLWNTALEVPADKCQNFLLPPSWFVLKWGKSSSINHSAAMSECSFIFLVVKGPAADATDAPQPWGFVCNPVMIIMIIFVRFQVMEHRWNETDGGKLKYSGEKTGPVPLCPPQIRYGLNGDRNRASALEGRRITAWAMARPNVPSSFCMHSVTWRVIYFSLWCVS
jgi:hypothetical protein